MSHSLQPNLVNLRVHIVRYVVFRLVAGQWSAIDREIRQVEPMFLEALRRQNSALTLGTPRAVEQSQVSEGTALVVCLPSQGRAHQPVDSVHELRTNQPWFSRSEEIERATEGRAGHGLSAGYVWLQVLEQLMEMILRFAALFV